ncbi:MAG TPA: antibiotic biosynthesis monooxygenase [Pyrinomonadaceae bacterium]|nr:antibiotic biosynthesis monooxygenase [Pyrinomonadaceae bacterium]
MNMKKTSLLSFLKVAVLLSTIATICFANAHLTRLTSASMLPMADLPVTQAAETTPQANKVVARMWHGRTRTSRADEYYAYLKEAGINKIEAIEGNLGAQVWRMTNGETTEFTVVSYWVSREAIKKFAGDDIEKTHNLPKDPEYLLELEPKVKHFDVVYDGRKDGRKPKGDQD